MSCRSTLRPFPIGPACGPSSATTPARLWFVPSGGLSVGRGLLNLCGQAYTEVAKTIPDLRMVLVCGPGISPGSLDVPSGVDVRGFVPDLYKHMAASDLAVVQSGGTTTLELTALGGRSSTSRSKANASRRSPSRDGSPDTAQV